MARPTAATASLLGLALMLTACASSPAPAPAETSGGVSSSSACAAATLTVSPDRGTSGTRFDVAGEGYVVCGDTGQPTSADAVSVVDVHWIQDGETVDLGEASAAEDGTLSGSFSVPEDAGPGEVELVATDALHVSSEPATFTVE